MAKQRVRFAEEIDDADEIPNSRLVKKAKYEEFYEDDDNNDNKRFLEADSKKKHTLDSDEEDESVKYEKLDMKNVDGQEEATEEYDGRTKIMAFNMKEDMEEGHFDQNGTFIFDKKDADIKDAWLDNIDWDNVKNRAGKLWHKEGSGDNNEEDDEMSAENKPDVKEIYKNLLPLFTSQNETIAALLKRLNTEKKLSAAEERKQRWAAKKAGKPFENGNSAKVAELTTLVDGLISMGQMNAYQLDSSKLRILLKEMENPASSSAAKEATFDMFGDEPAEQASTSSAAEKKAEEGDAVETMWEYRVRNENGELDEETLGPISNSRIARMQADDVFKQGGVARRVGTEQFYDIKRLDFELYE